MKPSNFLFSQEVIRELFQDSIFLFKQLHHLYERIPPTRCARKTHCCSMLPETTLLEALWALRQLADRAPEDRRQIVQKLVGYFFANAVQITSCPFLNVRQCVIYQDRFFGCRAYGLWSPQHYEKISARSRQAKTRLQAQWQTLGISLPQNVVNFRVPYCPEVEIIDGLQIDDETLLHISNRIETLAQYLAPWHQTFERTYFSDLSFVVTSLAFGLNQAVQMKVDFVRDYLATGSTIRLANARQQAADLIPISR